MTGALLYLGEDDDGDDADSGKDVCGYDGPETRFPGKEHFKVTHMNSSSFQFLKLHLFSSGTMPVSSSLNLERQPILWPPLDTARPEGLFA